MTRQLRGSCYCRATRYRVADAFEYAMNCHCSKCRQRTGSAFKPIGGIAVEAVSLVPGGEARRVGDEKAHDVMCGECGSLLYAIVRDGQYAHVALGTLEDSPAIRPTHHIFVGSKAPWFDITDDLPQFEEFG